MTDADGTDRIRRTRLRAQLLSGPPATTVDDTVGRLLAVQAQDRRGFRLAVRSRSEGLAGADVDAALDDRRLVVTWLNRGTLHLVRSEDYRWLHRLTAHRTRPGVSRRLRQMGVDPDEEERGVATVVGSLEREGPLRRRDLRARLDADGVSTEGQVLVHLLASASLQGLVVQGPVTDGDHAFVAVDRWLGPDTDRPDPDADLDRLARRYLAGHAPAESGDLASWAGITKTAARRAFDLVGDGLRSVNGGWIPGDRRGGPPPPPGPRLLGPFDPVLHGWSSRAPFVGAHGAVVTVNGIFRASCLVGGRIVGTWTLPARGPVIDLFEPVSPSDRDRLLADAVAVTAFLGHAGGPASFTGAVDGPAG